MSSFLEVPGYDALDFSQPNGPSIAGQFLR